MKNYQDELMVITMEECGELVQACSKAIRKNEFYDNAKLIEEAGDVYCMLNLLIEYDMVSLTDLERQSEVKRAKLAKWSELVVDNEDYERMRGNVQ
jgi:NTP pyrophosphatase (non-canonical NTP hydrolase)